MRRWITGELDGRPIANNTVRFRLSFARTLFAFCIETGALTESPTARLTTLTRQYPKTYGKKQDKNPARFLTPDEAARLIEACSDGTWLGSRDQLIIRFGLLGLRASEIKHLTWSCMDTRGRIAVTGKGRKVRTVSPGPALLDLLGRWKRQNARELGRPVCPDDAIIPRQRKSVPTPDQPFVLDWGVPIRANSPIWQAVTRRAALAGLGHVAPHDLRRTAANILHNARSKDGGHLYDLLDIQQVLDHADPATTMKSYISQMDTETKDRAGRTLDF